MITYTIGDFTADINWVDDSASSTSQMIAMLIITLHLPITAIIAEFFYIGIVSDTNRFHYPVVNSTTFEILAFLTSYHFNLSKIYDQTIATLQLKALILTNYVLSDEKIITCLLPASLLKPLQNSAFISNEQVDLLANINGVKIWMMFS